MGTWGIPKALLSREKTLTKATLQYSLKALYEGPVASVQRVFRDALENQWYPEVLRSLGYDPKETWIKHVWNPVGEVDSELLKALVKGVKDEVIPKQKLFEVMGWEKEEMIEEGEVQGEVKEEEVHD